MFHSIVLIHSSQRSIPVHGLLQSTVQLGPQSTQLRSRTSLVDGHIRSMVHSGPLDSKVHSSPLESTVHGVGLIRSTVHCVPRFEIRPVCALEMQDTRCTPTPPHIRDPPTHIRDFTCHLRLLFLFCELSLIFTMYIV